MSERLFICPQCGEERVAPTATGKLPARCDVCDPAAARRRDRDRARTAAALAHRDELGGREANATVQALRDRVAELEHALAFEAEAERASILIREPGKMAVAQAVRRLAAANGRHDTSDRLLELAAAARSWARVLVAPEGRQEAD